MGNIETRSQLPDKKAFHILDYGYCRVWKRKTDQLQTMEEYHLAIQSEQRLKLFENAWPLRTNHSIFVNVYYFSHHKAASFCSEVARGSLFTQRIPYRLSEFANVKYPQIMSIMKSCIEGYSILYQQYGLFIIRSTMIGFTESFQTKIWLHTDFSQPEPQNPNCKNLQEMYVSLVSSVQSACEYLYYNCPRFSEFIVQTNYVYFSKDFNLLMKGLETYCQKLGIVLTPNLGALKNYMKQPEGWEKFKGKNAYPKLIPTETDIDIESAKMIPQLVKVHTFQQNGKMPIPQSYFSKKQVIQQTISQQPQMLTPQLKKTYSSKGFGNQTSSRVLFESFSVEPQRFSQNSSNIYGSTTQNQYTSRPQIVKKDEIKFWRSSQKVNINQPKIESNNNKLINSVSMTRFSSPPLQMNFKPLSNDYYAENLHEIKQLSSKRASESRSSENFNFGRKSFDMSTDTRIRDKSLKEQFSLIEDLEVQARRSVTPINQLKFN